MMEKLYIYLISQDVNNDYDTYDSAVVIAKNEEEAKKIHPSPSSVYPNANNEGYFSEGNWVEHTQQVKVRCIGTANSEFKPNTIVLSSFNAG
jgi:hypothetical protein